MSTLISRGTATSFSNTPQAGDDLFTKTGLTEDSVNTVYLDVMGNDLGGKAKTLWSLDDALSSSTSTKTYAPADLLVQDTGRLMESTQDCSKNGARIWITTDGKVGYNPSTLTDVFKARLQSLAEGDLLTDSFTYAIRLGNGTLSWATAEVQFTGTNDAPVISGTANNASDGVKEDTDSSATGTLTSTDIDNGASATWSIEGGTTGTYGSLALTGNTGVWTYSLANGTNGVASAVQSLAAGETVTDTFTVRVTDDKGVSADQTVTITITGTNDAAINIVPGAQIATEDIVKVFSAANGNQISISDVDNTSHTLTLTATNGTVSLNGTAGLTFITGNGVANSTMTFSGTDSQINAALNGMSFLGASNYNGNASLQIVTSDGVLSDSDTISINVNPVNDAPTAIADRIIVSNNTAVTILASSLLDNDTDIDGAALTLTGVSAAAGITGLTLNANGTISFTSGAVTGATAGSFQYTLSDGNTTTIGTVTIDIRAVDVGGNNQDSIDLSAESYQASFINGNLNSDQLTGGARFDNLIGGAAQDTLIGGSGNDILRGGASNNNIMDGGAGIDLLDFSDGTSALSFTLVQSAADTTISNNTAGLGNGNKYKNMEGVIGTSLIDTINGSAQNDVIRGLAGNDTLNGNAGNDTIRGGAGNDIIDGSVGTGDLIDFSDATAAITLTLTQSIVATSTGALAGIGTDSYTNIEGVIGSIYNDTLTGSSSADTLIGGAGADRLTGGLGSDTFRYLNADASAVDTVTDFTVGTVLSGGDVIDIIDLLLGAGATAANLSNFVSLRESNGNTIISVDQDGAGIAPAQDIVSLTGITTLSLAQLQANGEILFQISVFKVKLVTDIKIVQLQK